MIDTWMHVYLDTKVLKYTQETWGKPIDIGSYFAHLLIIYTVKSILWTAIFSFSPILVPTYSWGIYFPLYPIIPSYPKLNLFCIFTIIQISASD